MASSTSTPTPPIILRSPSKYATTSPTQEQQPSQHVPPSLAFLQRTWTVTHSTLPMWRSAKNVRITYTPHPPLTTKGAQIIPRLNDIVSSVPTKKTWLPQPKQIEGIDTAVMDENGRVVGWKWVGNGLMLKIAGGSYWEVLGWGGDSGEGEGERWVVTWFEKTLFTPEGLDVYCDRKGGMSEGLFKEIEAALGRVAGGGVAELCEREMRGVVVDDA